MSKQYVRILHVDDNKGDLELFREALEGEVGYIVTSAQGVIEANELVLEAFKADRPFDIALVDLNLGSFSGADFARRFMDITGGNVVILTGYHDSASQLSFIPDGVVIKGFDMGQTHRTLNRVVRGLTEPKRVNTNPTSVKINQWNATASLFGINDLRFFTQEFPGRAERQSVEKMILLDKDGEQIICVIEPVHSRDRFVTCRLQTTIGCDQMCPSCKYWRIQKKPGCVVKRLSQGEIVSQLYHMMMRSERFREVFRNDSELGINIQFTGQGDVGNNLAECAKAMWQMAEIKKPLVSFLVSSVGIIPALKQYIAQECTKIPRTRYSLSLYSPDPNIREILIPGSKGSSIEENAELHVRFAVLTGTEIDVVVPLFYGINDSKEDARKVAHFCIGRPFRPVLIAGNSVGYSGVLKNLPDTPAEKIAEFRRWLIEYGVKRVKVRKSLGSGIGENSGLGQTIPNFKEVREKSLKAEKSRRWKQRIVSIAFFICLIYTILLDRLFYAQEVDKSERPLLGVKILVEFVYAQTLFFQNIFWYSRMKPFG